MPVANPCQPQSRKNRGESDPAVLIFARAPVPAHCKTRLARDCHPRRATNIYRALLEHVVATVCVHTAADCVTLVCTPSIHHAFFRYLARRYNVALSRQPRGDLGARMHAAIRTALARRQSVVLIGSDQPQLDDQWLTAARATLACRGSAWLAPTIDGGYWAIGLRRPAARVFRGPLWGTARVARRTHRNAIRCGLAINCWPARMDIDTWRDWCRLPRALRTRLARRATLSRNF